MPDGILAAAVDAVEAHLRYELPVWLLRSMQHLLDLPTAFRLRHGHAVNLQVLESI